MNRKFLPLVFLVGLVALILFQNKAVMPFVEKVASSDLFLVDTEDQGSRLPMSTSMTNYAFIQCNKEIRGQVDSEIDITFPPEPLQSWSLGNYKYIINAEIELGSDTGTTFFKKYACQVQYDNGSDQEGIMDSDNWSIKGISGISGL